MQEKTWGRRMEGVIKGVGDQKQEHTVESYPH